MADMVEAPQFVEALLDRIFEWNMAVLDEMLKHPFDGVLFGDDWGQQRGLMFGAKRWRQFIKPRAAAMYRKVADSGQGRVHPFVRQGAGPLPRADRNRACRCSTRSSPR